jgi:hydroxymethylpyrimidine kinase/phosphomethylpyrimidine kinase
MKTGRDIKKALTIAGSDSGGGAGIQADLKTFSALGVYGMTVITAVTAQNTVRVDGVEGIPARFVGLQFESVLTDLGVDGAKTGMLFNSAIVFTVAEKLRENRIPYLVVDPVMVAKGGSSLLEKEAVHAVKNNLIPLATLVTPNIPEAELLAGMSIESIPAMEDAAYRIADLGCEAVLLKGGHLPGDALDILVFEGHCHRFSSPRIDTPNTHGTGCTYSAAILSFLIQGIPLVRSVLLAKQYVTAAIEKAFPLGKGHGPLNHFVSPGEAVTSVTYRGPGYEETGR